MSTTTCFFRLIKKESGHLKRINILECVIIYKSKHVAYLRSGFEYFLAGFAHDPIPTKIEPVPSTI